VDNVLAESSQTIVGGLIRRGIGPFDVRIVGERHIFDAEGEVGAQRVQTAVNHLSSFQCQEDCDFSLPAGAPNIVGGFSEHQVLGMPRYLPEDSVDLRESAFNRRRPRDFAGLPNRKKNRSDSAGPHAGNIDAAVFVAPRQIEIIENEALCGVDMRIDHDRAEMKIARPQIGFQLGIFARFSSSQDLALPVRPDSRNG